MPWRDKLTLLAHGLFYFLQVLHPIGLALLCVLLVRGGAPAIGATFVALVLAGTAVGIAMSLCCRSSMSWRASAACSGVRNCSASRAGQRWCARLSPGSG